MIRINLLPYRTQRRQTKILQHLVVALGVVFVAASLVFTADLIKTQELTTLEDTFSELKIQNATLQKKIGKIKDLDKLRTDVERKLELVEELQKGRFHALETLNKLATVIPENVWLQSIATKEETITISGLGESNKAVANFMRALDQEAVFSNIALSQITRTQLGNIPVRSFNLTMNRVTKEIQKKAKEGGK
jgi:type IV pilus assembly protein PilN